MHSSVSPEPTTDALMNLPSKTLPFEEYVQYDATALAELVRAGDVSPDELLATAIARAEAVNPALNAIVTPLYEKGRGPHQLRMSRKRYDNNDYPAG